MGDRTTCCIAGGGPAGAVLGLLLARAGIDVTVLEKHGDFLRDFRGDTVHPSTLEVLDELGLGDRFQQLEHRKITGLSVVTDEGEAVLSDLRELRIRHPYIALVPQWDLLTMITQEAARYPGFRLVMNAAVYDLVREGGRVAGVRYRDQEGGEHEIRALLTVAADGRHSVLREKARLPLRTYGVPLDVAWFRLPRAMTDRGDTFLRLGSGRMMAAINRTSYWQLGYMVPKGGFDTLRDAGVEALRASVAELLPFLKDRTNEIEFDRIGFLSVRIDRLRRWHRPGLLCIGDAAHAMSPVGGVGINLAVQDAVAAANLLAAPLRAGTVRDQDLAAVQRRRWVPTALVQAVQRLAHRAVGQRALGGDSPPPLRALERIRGFRTLRWLIARSVGYGPLPEHVRIPAIPVPPVGGHRGADGAGGAPAP